MKKPDFARGAEAAAGWAAQYATTHPFRVDDCVLAKMNLTKRKPRRNRQRLQDPRLAWLAGFAVALAEMHRLVLHGNDSAGVRSLAKGAGVTLATARQAGVDPYDLRELKKAGVT